MAGEPEHQKTAPPVKVFGLFGALGAAFSLFSLGHRLFQFGLAPIIADFVSYYRQIGEWVFGWVGFPFGLEIPGWLTDLWILSAVGTGIMVRAIDWDKERERDPSGFHPREAGPIALTFICLGITLSLIGLVGLLLLLLAFLLLTDRKNREFRREGLLLLAALLGFFVLNAYGPGV